MLNMYTARPIFHQVPSQNMT